MATWASRGRRGSLELSGASPGQARPRDSGRRPCAVATTDNPLRRRGPSPEPPTASCRSCRGFVLRSKACPAGPAETAVGSTSAPARPAMCFGCGVGLLGRESALLDRENLSHRQQRKVILLPRTHACSSIGMNPLSSVGRPAELPAPRSAESARMCVASNRRSPGVSTSAPSSDSRAGSTPVSSSIPRAFRRAVTAVACRRPEQ